MTITRSNENGGRIDFHYYDKQGGKTTIQKFAPEVLERYQPRVEVVGSLWIAGEAGLVVPHETAELSDALLRVLGSAEEHARLAAGCAKVTQRLGWEEPVFDMESLYTSLATKPASKAESQLPE